MPKLLPSDFPDLPALNEGLAAVFHDIGPVEIVDRAPNRLASTAASDVVTCRLGDGRVVRLLCKYGGPLRHESHGYSGGVPYEAVVYRTVLRTTAVTTAQLYGAYQSAAGETWLILEFLDRAKRVDRSREPGAVQAASRWAGRFHAVTAARLADETLPSLTVHSPDYFRGWAQRTAENADLWRERFPWLDDVCAGFVEITDWLAAASPVIIHGEFYPHNVLVRDGTAYPVDWESTAVAAGEIDLVSLTEGWPEAIVRECEVEYCAARWPDGEPADFQRRLAAARLYWSLRWLGSTGARIHSEKYLRRITLLHDASVQFGLIHEGSL
jgi:hypothetical protein